MNNEKFPIDLSQLKPLKLDPKRMTLSDEEKATLRHNIQLCRDAIVFFTALAGAKAMRDAYARVLAADSSCADCYLGLGVYQYGLGRAGALARFVAKLVGLGSGNAESKQSVSR